MANDLIGPFGRCANCREHGRRTAAYGVDPLVQPSGAHAAELWCRGPALGLATWLFRPSAIKPAFRSCPFGARRTIPITGANAGGHSRTASGSSWGPSAPSSRAAPSLPASAVFRPAFDGRRVPTWRKMRWSIY